MSAIDTTKPLRIAALIGGGGRTLLNIADEIDAGRLPAQIALVIASRESIPGVQRARDRNLPMEIADAREDGEEAAQQRINDLLRDANVDLLCLGGWLRWLRLDPRWHGRVINIHPSLLPKFGGRGMYGMRVHQAVLEAGERESGCTVHFVDEVYDRGPIILRRRCAVEPGDTPESLAARVFMEECIAYPEVIRLFAAHRVRLADGQAVIDRA